MRKVLVIGAAVAVFLAGVVVGRVTVHPGASGGAGGQPTTGLLNVWLIGPPGQNVMFCPHPELMTGGVGCQPMSKIAPFIPDNLPSPRTGVAPGCATDFRLVFNFADRSRAEYPVCSLPTTLVPLYEAAWNVLMAPPPSATA